MTKKRSFPKDVHQLMKSVDSVTAGQVTVGPLEDNSDDDCDQEQKGSITIEVSPSDGAYEGGKFKFEISVVHEYPLNPPVVRCLTEIYHPNIDMDDMEDVEDSNICVSLLEQGEWDTNMTLEHCVQAILFLFYNPNWGDALSPLFASDCTNDDFVANVKISLEGGDIDGRTFQRNYGLPPVKAEVITDIQEGSSQEGSELTELEKEMNGINIALSTVTPQDNNVSTDDTLTTEPETREVTCDEPACNVDEVIIELPSTDPMPLEESEIRETNPAVSDSADIVQSNSEEINLPETNSGDIVESERNCADTEQRVITESDSTSLFVTRTINAITLDLPITQNTKSDKQGIDFLRSLSVGDTPRDEEGVLLVNPAEAGLKPNTETDNAVNASDADVPYSTKTDDQIRLLLPECSAGNGENVVKEIPSESCCDDSFVCCRFLCFR